MTETTDWGSALAMLAAGLIAGAMFVYFFARRRTSIPEPPADTVLRDLEGKRDVLVARLREELPDDERTRLEIETAQVLRAIDEHRATKVTAPGLPRQSAEPLAANRAGLIGFAWGAGSMLMLGLLGYFVMQAAKPREDQQPQQAMQQAAPADPAVQQLEALVQRNPEDLQARVNLAQAYLEREHLMGVFEQTQVVLSKEPDNSRALTLQALVRMAMGQTPAAVQMLERATKVDPMLLDAWVGLAWVKTQEGKVAEAEAAMREAMRRRPDEKERLEQVLTQMKSHEGVDMSKAAPASAPSDAHPPVPSAPGGTVDAKAVRITVSLDSGVARRDGVLYVIARAAGVRTGPPVAVKRLPATSLPVTFDLTSADSMMGQPLPATVRVEARLDADGDAATRDPSEPTAAVDPVSAGSAITLTLK